jgi:hypothetical protein
MRKILIATVCCIFPISADAEDDVNTFIKKYDAGTSIQKQLMTDALEHIQLGLEWANTVLGDRKALYCPPPHLVLTGGQLLDMLRREGRDDPVVKGTAPIGLILIVTLKKHFPCQNSN